VQVRLSLGAVLVVCLAASTIAQAAGPGDVYSDFAQDGKLSCAHSRADLTSVLHSGALDQYGDPYTLTRLKLAVRRQLTGGCRRRTSSEPTAAARAGGGTSKPTNRRDDRGRRDAQEKASKRVRTYVPRSANLAASANSGDRAFISERVLVAGLALGILAVGGWLTRRALIKPS
jgi:hypothetical protein